MKEFEALKIAVGTIEILHQMPLQKPMQPFAEETINFLDKWSENIRKRPDIRQMPDAAAFGFWCRKAGILQLKKEYKGRLNRMLGKGITLHFAPSNIPVLFAFSMTAALLTGNCILLRLSSKQTPLAEAMIESLALTLKDFPEWAPRIVLFRYEHNKKITDLLSSMCDVRIMWGGDASIEEIRKSHLSKRATELPFADRSSAALLDAAAVLKAADLYDMVNGFYNDTYLNDQNACSSPRIIYWLGSLQEAEAAKERFWHEVYTFSQSKYKLEPVLAVKKWEQALYMAAKIPKAKVIRNGNLVIRVAVTELLKEYWEETVPGGFFIEAQGENLDGLLPILTRKCQTLASFGVSHEEIADFIVEHRVTGVDRVTEFGHTLDFSLVWDGVDLINSMTRIIV